MYKYSKLWFLDSDLKLNWRDYINPDEPNRILEIGCYEGLSSVFFADNCIRGMDPHVEPDHSNGTIIGKQLTHLRHNLLLPVGIVLLRCDRIDFPGMVPAKFMFPVHPVRIVEA